MAEDAKWYVAHTYSGYENKVKANIEKTVENHGMQDLICDVVVPTEDVVEKKGQTEKVVKHKIFPGYVMIKMVMNDESWYVVRNTRGVTGFVGPGSKPVPLTQAEVEKMGVEKTRPAELRFNVGDAVNVKSGPMEGFSGIVQAVSNETRTVSVKISMFGRDTMLDIDPSQIELAE